MSDTMCTNKELSVKENNMFLMVLSDFSNGIIWGIHTGLLNMRKYGDNLSYNGKYSAIRPSFVCVFLRINQWHFHEWKGSITMVYNYELHFGKSTFLFCFYMSNNTIEYLFFC